MINLFRKKKRIFKLSLLANNRVFIYHIDLDEVVGIKLEECNKEYFDDDDMIEAVVIFKNTGTRIICNSTEFKRLMKEWGD